MGERGRLLREREPSFPPVVSGWRRPRCKIFRARGGREVARRRCLSSGARVVAATLAGDVANSWNIEGGASGRQHGGCETEAHAGRMEIARGVTLDRKLFSHFR